MLIQSILGADPDSVIEEDNDTFSMIHLAAKSNNIRMDRSLPVS